MRVAAVREPVAISSRLLICAALATALLVGVALAASPPKGFALLLAVGYVPLAFLNLPVALACWIPLIFIMRLGLFSVAPLACLLLLTLSWLGTLRREVEEGSTASIRVHVPVLAVIAAFEVWLLLSTLWATDTPTALSDVPNWLTAVLVFLLAAFTGSSSRHARRLVWAFVAGATLSVMAGLIGLDPPAPADALQAAQTVDRSRLSGGSGDPNYLAAAIVPAVVLLAGLVSRRQPLLSVIAAPVAILLLFGLLATASRGGLLAAGVAILTALVVFRTRRIYVLVAVGVLFAFAAAWLSANPEALERISSIDEGGNGRTELWQVALRIWEDSPILGAGLNNFVVVSGDYVRQPGGLQFVQLIAERPHVAHNAYLQLLAETGIIGLALFLTVLGASIRASLLATKSFAGRGDEEMANLGRSVTVALIASAASSFFLSNGGEWTFWLLLGLGPALLATARRDGAGTPLPA